MGTCDAPKLQSCPTRAGGRERTDERVRAKSREFHSSISLSSGYLSNPPETYKVLMMKLVKHVASSGPCKPIVADPRSHGAINDASHGNRRVSPAERWNQSRAVVRRSLYRMHRGSAKGGGIVTLVVEGVDVLVEELSDIRHAPALQPLVLPGMHCAMYSGGEGVGVRVKRLGGIE